MLTAVVAVVLALLAGLLAWQYLSDADERAEEDAELVDVLVAAEDIPVGTSGQTALDDKLFTEERVPAKARPDGALAPGDEDQIAGLVAAGPISKGQFIVEGSFQESAQVSGLAGTLGEGDQAISFQVDDTRGIGGFVSPGDRVNVILNLEIAAVRGSAPGAPPVNTTAFLLPGLEVLAVGDTTVTPVQQTADDTTEQREIPAGIITVRVNARQALQIAHAQQNGTILLSLNPRDFSPETSPEIVETDNLFDQPMNEVLRVQEQLRAGG
ncbi:MAG TPA: Flp pilus assembly protein CpaB [Acidimicrobiia bacterium]|nr:Flp pilus assembly protein CpaB [Acidimicrobiia bacterium]